MPTMTLDDLDPMDEAPIERLNPHPSAPLAWMARYRCVACSTSLREMTHALPIPRNAQASGDERVVMRGLRPACDRNGLRRLWLSDPDGLLPTSSEDPGTSELI